MPHSKLGNFYFWQMNLFNLVWTHTELFEKQRITLLYSVQLYLFRQGYIQNFQHLVVFYKLACCISCNSFNFSFNNNYMTVYLLIICNIIPPNFLILEQTEIIIKYTNTRSVAVTAERNKCRLLNSMKSSNILSKNASN